MGGTCIGSWLKVFSIAPDRFWVTFVGQTIVALSQTYVLSIPVPMAATWFSAKEVSTACSLGLLGAPVRKFFVHNTKLINLPSWYNRLI
jgi:MFS transporter, FLVCR family, feline leukemia virus subgroup C receptor-related protein